MRGTRKTKTNQTDLEGMKGRTGLEWPERGEWMRSEQQKQAYGIEMGEGVYAVTEGQEPQDTCPSMMVTQV